MKRRSFLAMLGLAPAAATSVALTPSRALDGEIIPPARDVASSIPRAVQARSPRHGRCESITAGKMRSASGDIVFDLSSGSIVWWG